MSVYGLKLYISLYSPICLAGFKLE